MFNIIMLKPIKIISWDKSRGWRHTAYIPVIFVLSKFIDVDVVNVRNKKPTKTTIPPICELNVVNGCGVKLKKYKQIITADKIK